MIPFQRIIIFFLLNTGCKKFMRNLILISYIHISQRTFLLKIGEQFSVFFHIKNNIVKFRENMNRFDI